MSLEEIAAHYKEKNRTSRPYQATNSLKFCNFLFISTKKQKTYIGEFAAKYVVKMLQ